MSETDKECIELLDSVTEMIPIHEAVEMLADIARREAHYFADKRVDGRWTQSDIKKNEQYQSAATLLANVAGRIVV